MLVTVDHLRKIAGGAAPLAPRLAGPINRYAAEYGINTVTLLSCWLAHMCHETGGFRLLEENLNYSASRLRQVWPSRFKTDAVARAYANNPQKLANKVYGGRLGNTGPNDGWLFRGSGPMQTTGKSNFATVKAVTGTDVVANPDLLREPDMGVRAAAIYFNARVRPVAGDIRKSTYAVNGGYNGLEERQKFFERAKTIIPAALKEQGSATPKEPDALGGTPHVDYTRFKRGVSYPLVEEAQALLIAKGYPGVGDVDGKWGSMTRNSLNAFRADNGMPVDNAGADIEYTIEQLNAAAPRQLPPERSMATLADIAPKSEIIPRAQDASWWSKLTGWLGAGGTVVYGLKDTVPSTADSIRPYREYFPDLPPSFWLLLAVALAAGVAFTAWRASRKANRVAELKVDEYRSGGRA